MHVYLSSSLAAAAVFVAGCVSEKGDGHTGLLSAPTVEVRLEEDLRLGETEPYFGSVGDVSVSDDGTIYVANYGSPRSVFVFANDGTHIGEVGGQGEGPGEFSFPSSVFVQGDSVSVYDANAYTDASATFVRFDGSVGEPLFTSPPQERINVTDPGGGAAFASRPDAFYRETVCSTMPDRFYCAWTGELRFQGATTDGEILGPISVSYEPVAVSVTDRARAEKRMTPKMLAVSRRHETYPALGGLASDDRGRLWARVRMTADVDRTDYWIIDPRSMTSSAASVDGSVDVKTVRGDEVYAVVRSPDHGVVVVRYRIRE